MIFCDPCHGQNLTIYHGMVIFKLFYIITLCCGVRNYKDCYIVINQQPPIQTWISEASWDGYQGKTEIIGIGGKWIPEFGIIAHIKEDGPGSWSIIPTPRHHHKAPGTNVLSPTIFSCFVNVRRDVHWLHNVQSHVLFLNIQSTLCLPVKGR